MHVSTLALPLILAFTVSAHMPADQSRRQHARGVAAVDYYAKLAARQFPGAGANDSNLDAGEPSSSASGTSSAAYSGTTSGNGAPSSSQPPSSSAAPSSTSSAAPSSSAPPSTSEAPSSSPSSTAPSSTQQQSTSSSIPAPSVATTASNTPTAAAPSTIVPPQVTQSLTTTLSQPSLVSQTLKGSAIVGPSADANSLTSDGKSSSSGLSKPAMIAIIIVSVVLGVGAIGFTLFRKTQLKKSKRFNARMKSIDFGPSAGLHGNDDFFEKTLHRSNSNSTTANQRNMLAAEIDTPNHVAGIPEHDFTADPGHQQNAAGVYDMYNQDPYYHAEAYEYNTDPTYGYQNNGYPVGAGVGAYNGGMAADQLTQDQPVNNGYADLQRGNSNGSGSGHGHQHQHTHAPAQPQVYPSDFPNPESYLGRPTGHGEGPYAQAAVYRGAY